MGVMKNKLFKYSLALVVVFAVFLGGTNIASASSSWSLGIGVGFGNGGYVGGNYSRGYMGTNTYSGYAGSGYGVYGNQGYGMGGSSYGNYGVYNNMSNSGCGYGCYPTPKPIYVPPVYDPCSYGCGMNNYNNYSSYGMSMPSSRTYNGGSYYEANPVWNGGYNSYGNGSSGYYGN